MQQIKFTVPSPDMVEKILVALRKMDFVSNIHVDNLNESYKDQIIPAKRTAHSLEEMLADWTDLEESTTEFRAKLWKTKSF